MRNLSKKFLQLVGIFAFVNLVGCSTQHDPNSVPEDPYEHFNRNVFNFNMALDKAVIRPVAKGYDKVFPWFVKRGVRNFFANLGEVSNVINDVLQVDPRYAISDSWRLAINTTVGIGGLFDVASKAGLPQHRQDYGLTLAKWGSRNTPYIMLPILGPSTERDLIGLPFDFLSDPFWYVKPFPLALGMGTLKYVDARARLLPADKLFDEAFDPYVLMRDAYLQRRAYLIDKMTNKNQNNHDDVLTKEKADIIDTN